MKKDVLEKLKIKWWEHFPILGAIVYTLRVEFFLNNQSTELKKTTKKYKTIANFVFIGIAIPFIVCFFVLRNKHGFGSYPWFFWLGLSIGLSQNITPFIARTLYLKGLKKYKETPSI